MITLTDEQCEALGVPKGSTVGGTLVHNDAQMVALYPPKPKRWEPKGGDWTITGEGEIARGRGPKTAYRLDGSQRETQEAAKRASKLITRYKRLLAYVDEHRREGEEDNCRVYFTCGSWDVSHHTESADIGSVIMPYRVAEQLIADLQSGVYVYDETKRPKGVSDE